MLVALRLMETLKQGCLGELRLSAGAMGGTPVTWKEVGGAGGLLVVRLRMVAAFGGCGDLVSIIMGFNNNLDRNVEGSLPARRSDCTPAPWLDQSTDLTNPQWRCLKLREIDRKSTVLLEQGGDEPVEPEVNTNANRGSSNRARCLALTWL